MEIVRELWAFLRTRKKYWLWPIFLMMALLGVAISFRGCDLCVARFLGKTL